jgi:hypothetical protein
MNTFKNGQERWMFRKGQEPFGTVNGQGHWTVRNVHTLQDVRSETFAKSRSRFKYERIPVFTLYIYSKFLPKYIITPNKV